MVSVSSAHLLDRVVELARLRQAWREAVEGQPRLAILTGEAGIGKSRLLRELLGEIERDGGFAFSGTCVHLGDTPIPFVPVAEIARRLVATDDPMVREALAPLGDALAPLAPFGPGGAGRAARATELSEPAARARLFEAALALVTRLSSSRPLAIGVEDVQWADGATRDLLTFLVRNVLRERWLLVVTVRTDGLAPSDPVAGWLAELARMPLAERIDLERLTQADVDRQVRAIVGDQVSPSALEAIWRRSEGNPFFVEELLASGAAEAPARPAHGVPEAGSTGRAQRSPDAPAGRRPALPDTIADTLLARVGGLPPEERTLVEAVGIAGVPVEEDLLAVALGRSPAVVRLHARALVQAGLLWINDLGRLQPRHVLLGEVVESSLLAGERRELHEALARALDVMRPPPGAAGGPDVGAGSVAARGALDAAAVAAARARHWLAAGDEARAYAAALEAAAAASAVHAHAEAAAHLRVALSLADRRSPPPSAAERIDLLLRTGDALDLAGDSVAAERLIVDALALVDPASDPALAGMLHKRIGFFRWVADQGDEALAEHRLAADLVPAEPPSLERADVLGALGGALMVAGHHAESRRVCEEAVRVARSVGATVQEGRARSMLGSGLVALGRVEEGLQELRLARQLAEAGSPIDVVVVAHHNLALNLLLADRSDEAVEEALAGRELARRVGLRRRYGPHLVGVAADALYRTGRWDEAAELADDELAEVGGHRSTVHLAAVRVRLHAGRGERSLAADGLEATGRLLGHDPDPDLAAYVALAGAEAGLLAGAFEDALASARSGLHALEASEDAGSAVPLLAVAARALAELADDARAARHPDRAQVLAAEAGELATRARTMAHDAATPSALAWAERAAAEAARAAGDARPDAWAAAVANADAARMPVVAAEGRLRLAESILLERGDRTRAAEALRDALAVAVRVGARPLGDAVVELARRARVETAAAPSGEHAEPIPVAPGHPPTTLSDRELEVLRLVAEGRSNGEIAEALFITRKTASAHVTHILDKLGVSNRLEAAMTAARLGLLATEEATAGDPTAPDR